MSFTIYISDKNLDAIYAYLMIFVLVAIGFVFGVLFDVSGACA